ncbi:MAG: hypothetical protein WA990_11830 [Rubrobacteraceae bacterium]
MPLLVLALILCHGALGSMDKLVLDPVPSVAVHQLQNGAGEPGPASGNPVEHAPSYGSYIVAFLTVMVGVFSGLLFRGAVPARRIIVGFQRIRRSFGSNAYLPRLGPTPILLQVFRL